MPLEPVFLFTFFLLSRTLCSFFSKFKTPAPPPNTPPISSMTVIPPHHNSTLPNISLSASCCVGLGLWPPPFSASAEITDPAHFLPLLELRVIELIHPLRSFLFLQLPSISPPILRNFPSLFLILQNRNLVQFAYLMRPLFSQIHL